MRIALVAAIKFSVVALVCGCSYSSYTRQSAGIAEAQLLNSAFHAAVQDSDATFTKLKSSYRQAEDRTLMASAALHFAIANQISERFYSQLRQAYHSDSTRGLLLRRAGEVSASLTVVRAPNAFAKAFPGGQVLVSEALVMSLLGVEGEASPALIGVLLHELIHVRHGHAAQQWMTSDGRVQYFQDQAASGLAKLISLVPGLTIERTIGYLDTFELPDKLLMLSEYAADLGTILLLEQAQIDFKPYVNFLHNVHAQARPSDSRASYLAGRLKCINESQGMAPPSRNAIVLGDVELKTSKSASIARHEDPIGGLTSDDPLEVASARSFLHRACVVRHGLADLSKADATVVRGPYFDDSMFTDFTNLLWRNRSDSKKP